MVFVPVVLMSDALLFALIIGILTFCFIARRHEYMKAPWRKVLHNPLSMMSVIILAVYASIGILDSIHFRDKITGTSSSVVLNYSTDVKSLLDVIVSPLGDDDEETYSAPFAARLFTKQMTKNINGVLTQYYPRLVYGGKNLVNPEQDRLKDIFITTTIALTKAVTVWLVVMGLWIAILAYLKHISFTVLVKDMLRGRLSVPWRTIIGTIGIIIIFSMVSMALAMKYHILGTDKIGQDTFYQSIKSIRTGLLIGTITTLIMLPFAIILGIMAGYFQRWIDDIIQYVYTTLSSIPAVLLIASSILAVQIFMANHPSWFGTSAMKADVRLLALCSILGVTSWTTLCRLLRGESLKLREIDYIQAARALGVSHYKIITRHIFPNLMHIVIITVVLDFSGLVLAEAVLSYVGVGVDPSTISWGNMINAARLELARDPVVWWPICSAFIFMFALVLAANLFADGVRDAFDPKHQ
jgi:peptide/nickel transport system permease protein